MMLSLFMTLFGAPQPYKRVSSPLVRSAWLLYSFSGHFALLNALFWWLFIFERGETRLNWLNFIPHSILPFTIVLDGLNVNHIPLRWQHYTGFVIPMECFYVFWTYSQNVLGDFPNPNVSEEESNDYIYGAFNWDDKETKPLVMSLVGIFFIGPVFWLVMWLFSQYWLICCCLGDRRVVSHIFGACFPSDPKSTDIAQFFCSLNEFVRLSVNTVLRRSSEITSNQATGD
jgi:hypothetical protein